MVGNSDGTSLEFENPFVLRGRIDITADLTINSENASQYNRRLWFFDDSVTVTIESGTNLEFFGVYVRVSSDSVILNSTDGSNIRFDNQQAITISGRCGKILYEFNTDRFRTLLTNSIGVVVQDNSGTEGRQIQTLNFDTNLNVNVVDGVANIEALAGGDPLSEVQNRFLNSLNRDAINLTTQQTGFDLGVFLNPIDTVATGPGSDLADLNALNTNEFVADNNGTGFVYILFQ